MLLVNCWSAKVLGEVFLSVAHRAAPVTTDVSLQVFKVHSAKAKFLV